MLVCQIRILGEWLSNFQLHHLVEGTNQGSVVTELVNLPSGKNPIESNNEMNAELRIVSVLPGWRWNNVSLEWAVALFRPRMNESIPKDWMPLEWLGGVDSFTLGNCSCPTRFQFSKIHLYHSLRLYHLPEQPWRCHVPIRVRVRVRVKVRG